jgi:ribonuclease HI
VQAPILINAIYTDGSGGYAPYGGRGICGYAAIVWFSDDTIIILGGTEAHSTHQRVELLALITALQYLKQHSQSSSIFSDSKYAIDAINHNWIDKWQHNGWLNTKGNPIDDRDLWLQLLALHTNPKVFATFHHIMGHSDALGRKGRLAQIKNRDRYGLESDRHNLGNQMANLAAGQFRRGEISDIAEILGMSEPRH